MGLIQQQANSQFNGQNAERPKCGLEDGDRCLGLNDKNCDGCSFFKTPEQLNAEREAVAERLVKKGYYIWAVKHYSYFRALEKQAIKAECEGR